jgi:hypothetical protein
MKVVLDWPTPQVGLVQLGRRVMVLDMGTSHRRNYSLSRINKGWIWPFVFRVQELRLRERFTGEGVNWWSWWKRFRWGSTDLIPVFPTYRLEDGEKQYSTCDPRKHLKAKYSNNQYMFEIYSPNAIPHRVNGTALIVFTLSVRMLSSRGTNLFHKRGFDD